MDPSHLAVVLDLAPVHWHRSPLTLDVFLAQLLAFLNAHIALKHDNHLAVFAALPNRSVLLYASSDPPSLDTSVPSDPNVYPPFRRLDTAVTTRIAEELNNPELDVDAPSALVGALTKALCRAFFMLYFVLLYLTRLLDINRMSLTEQLVDPRILILSVSPDLSTAYIPIMNSIFSAQKLVSVHSRVHRILSFVPQKVTIDACQIFGADTVFLQQAAHLTGGSYLYLTETSALLQYLIVSHAQSSDHRHHQQWCLDVLFAAACHPEGPRRSDPRQDRFPGGLLLSQEYRRYWLRVLRLPVQ